MTDMIWKLETDIDDCSGEVMGHVLKLLMENGAREAHYMPIYTKKNRPAYTLTVICKEEDRENLENLIFAETTTDGQIRCYPEYESAEELASRNQISFREAYDSIRSYWTTER